MHPADDQLTTPDSTRPKVLVFRRELLRYSETFIANQVRALRRYSPLLVGTRRAELDPARLQIDTTTVSGARFAKVVEFGLMHGAPIPRLRRLLRDSELVHAHFGPDAALLVPALSRGPLRATPLVATFHGFDATVSDDGLRTLGRVAGNFVDARPQVFDRANRIIAVSEFVRTRLVAEGADPHKVVIHYIGTDTAFFWAPERSSAPPPSVLFLGRLHEKKGAADLLAALVRVSDAGVAAVCTVAGTGPEDAALRKLAHDLRLDVRFVGAVDPAQARELLHAARVLCVPSLTAANGDAEGFGLVFTEAQACGVPVVSYRSGGVPEAVADGETGLLATERDIDGLASRLLTILTDDERWLRMSRCARERTVARFDLATQTAVLEQIYDDCRHAVND